MKKTIITGLVLSLGIVSSQNAFSDIKAANQQNSVTQSQPSSLQTQNTSSWLGVWIEDIPMSLARHIAPLLKDNQGVIIRKVSPDSPAQAAGLQEYDVITAFNDQDIYSQKQLTALVRGTAPDTKVKLDIIHQGKPVSKEVVLKAAPAQQRAYHGPQKHPWPPFEQHPMPRQYFGQPGSMGLLPPPSWLNEPFFQQGFNQPVPQNAPVNRGMPPAPANQSTSWSESHFESIEIESTGNDKIRAAVKYEDSDGNRKEFVFEGNQDEIRKQIMNQKEMDNTKKQRLLQALDMSNTPPQFPEIPVPDWFNQPPPWFHNPK